MLKYVIVWLLLFAMMTVSLTFFFGPIVLLYLAAVLILHRRGTTAAERTSIPHEGVHRGNARRSRHHWRGVLDPQAAQAKAGCRSRRHHGHTRRRVLWTRLLAQICSGRRGVTTQLFTAAVAANPPTVADWPSRLRARF